MEKEKTIEHSGVVDRITGGTVYVKITAGSACGSCRAREACGMGEAQEKVVAVTTDRAAEYAPGEAVAVGVKRRIGGVAVALAYVGALAVLLTVLVISIRVIGLGEGAAALVSLASVGLYYGALWLFRHKIEHTIHFTITKR